MTTTQDQAIVTSTAVGFEERTSATVVPAFRVDTRRHSWLNSPAESWSWQQLRDYVVHQITLRNGGLSFSDAGGDSPAKVAGIMKRFHATYGENAGLIARYAFEVCEGWWMGQPIGISRFCKAGDQWFALVILDRFGLTK